jgi:hypothetical protein
LLDDLLLPDDGFLELPLEQDSALLDLVEQHSVRFTRRFAGRSACRFVVRSITRRCSIQRNLTLSMRHRIGNDIDSHRISLLH